MEATALTIDELAGRVGMTVRNLREWRTLGLLPAARMEGRAGYYDPEVVTRGEAAPRPQEEGARGVGAVQGPGARGFHLELSRRMHHVGGSGGGGVAGVPERLRPPYLHNGPPLLDLGEFTARWGKPTKAQLDAAVAAGVVR